MSHHVDCFLDYSESKLGIFLPFPSDFSDFCQVQTKTFVVGGGFSSWLVVCHVFTQIRSRYESLYAVKMLNLGTLGNLISSSDYFLMNSWSSTNNFSVMNVCVCVCVYACLPACLRARLSLSERQMV